MVMELKRLPIASIEIGKQQRDVSEKQIGKVAASLEMIGLRTPITVRPRKDKFILQAGYTRLEAAKLLRWTEIDCFIMTEKTASAHWRLVENEYRIELTALEHAEHLSGLAKHLRDNEGVQVAHPGGRQPHDKGLKRIARKLGVSREALRRAQSVAAIASEAKVLVKEAGLHRKQSALLEIARQPTPADQIAKAKELAVRTERGKRSNAQLQAAINPDVVVEASGHDAGPSTSNGTEAQGQSAEIAESPSVETEGVSAKRRGHNAQPSGSNGNEAQNENTAIAEGRSTLTEDAVVEAPDHDVEASKGMNIEVEKQGAADAASGSDAAKDLR